MVWWEKGACANASESFPIKSKQSVSEGVKNTSRPEGQSAAAVIAAAPPVQKYQCHPQGRQHPHPPLPLSPLPKTTPSPALPPALSSGHPNSSTAGLSHQLYGVSWCQLKELIRAAVRPCVCGARVSGRTERVRESLLTQIYTYL